MWTCHFNNMLKWRCCYDIIVLSHEHGQIKYIIPCHLLCWCTLLYSKDMDHHLLKQLSVVLGNSCQKSLGLQKFNWMKNVTSFFISFRKISLVLGDCLCYSRKGSDSEKVFGFFPTHKLYNHGLATYAFFASYIKWE